MITMMSIRATKESTGEARVFRSAMEAGREIGVTEGAIRYAMRKGVGCRGWRFEQIQTVCLVKMKDDGNYYVCTPAEGGGGFDMLAEDGEFLPTEGVLEVWDVTENFNRIRNGKYEARKNAAGR